MILEISRVFWLFSRFHVYFAHFRDFEDILVILMVFEHILFGDFIEIGFK